MLVVGIFCSYSMLQAGDAVFCIALCDDNELDFDHIEQVLAGLHDDGISYEVTRYRNGLDLIRDFNEGIRYHLLIIDMLMTPLDGIAVAKELRRLDVAMPILIVTSTMQYALDGYQVNAWRYLTKPVDEERLLADVRAIYEQGENNAPDVYFIVKQDFGITKIRVDEILYFESSLHTITAHTVERGYSFRGTIKGIEDNFRSSGFFRIHKSLVVNLAHIRKVTSGAVTLIDGTRLDLSRLRAAALYEALMDYVASDNTYMPLRSA